MPEIITGVYKVTNTITGEFYIGCSSNITNRWNAHKTRYCNILSKEYNKPLYVGMREYNVKNFSFEIIEESTIEEMLKREKYYISLLEATAKGYNRENKLSEHGRALLSVEDVIDIRTRYRNLESKKNVYADYMYSISKVGFHKIWNGYTWCEIMPEIYTDFNKHYHKNNTGNIGEQNGRTTLQDIDVMLIRQRKTAGESSKVVYETYSDKLSYKSFLNTWYGYNWKHIVA